METGAVLLGAAAAAGAIAAAPGRRQVQRAAVVAQLAALTVAIGLFARAVLVVDERLVEVAATTSHGTSWPYRLSGMWGGPRSSMLTFTWMLALVSFMVVGRVPRALGVSPLLIGVLSAVTVAFANPFAVLDVPSADPAGLAPILHHPAMLIHPPLLYLGLTITVASAIGAAHGDAVHRSVLVAWGVLALALALGSWWAYAELGWGGVWAWDPIEDAGLLPWLMLTAAVHAGHAGRTRLRRGLVMGAGWIALAGTALTRSGAGQSVHAFADERRLGRALAVLLGVLALAAVVVLVRWTADAAARPPTLALVASALGGVAATVIAVGTFAPIAADLLRRDRFTVQGTYYARFLLPVACAALVLIGVASRPSRRRRAVGAAAVTAAFAPATLLWPWWCAALVALAAGSLVLTIPARRASMTLAHAGFAVLLAGVGLSATGSTLTAGMRPHQEVRVQGHHVRFVGLEHRSGDEPRDRVIAVMRVRSFGSTVTLRPSLDTFRDQLSPLAESATAGRFGVDVQLVLRRVVQRANDASPAIVVDVLVRPFVRFVWWGAAMMGAGALLGAVGARRRGGTGSARGDGVRELVHAPLGSSDHFGSPVHPN